MAQRGIACIYLNPVSYRGSENSMRFRQIHRRNDHPNIQVIDRTSKLKKSFLEFIRENIFNIREVRRFKPEAVISTDHLMSTGVCIYCWIKQIPFVFDVTDNWELVDQSAAGKIYKRFLKPILARFSFAITSTSQRQFIDFKKRRKQNTYLIPNGINPQLQDQLMKEEPAKTSGSEVYFIGSLRDWYDFDLMFETFQVFPGINLHIYGQGPMYEELLEKSNSIPNIHVHGNIEPAKTAALLHQSLFGILPLKINELNHSTCPIKLFDYWGASLAVIASPLEELSRLGGDALLYASTREEYVRAINRLLNEDDLATKLGRDGKQKVDEAHNYKTITDQFIHILNTT